MNARGDCVRRGRPGSLRAMSINPAGKRTGDAGRLARHALAAFCLLASLAACAAFWGKPPDFFEHDGFAASLDRGCSGDTCSGLYLQAQDRLARCRQELIAYNAKAPTPEHGVCIPTENDLERANTLVMEMQRRREDLRGLAWKKEQEESAAREEEARAEDARQLQQKERDARTEADRVALLRASPSGQVAASVYLCERRRTLQSIEAALRDMTQLDRESGTRDLADRRDTTANRIEVQAQVSCWAKGIVSKWGHSPVPCKDLADGPSDDGARELVSTGEYTSLVDCD